jgi:Flp pilus assembly pilin Flp
LSVRGIGAFGHNQIGTSAEERIVMSKGHFVASMRKSLSDFLVDERGGRAIEFSLLAVGILVAIIAAAAAFGTSLDAAPSAASNRPD